MRVIADAAQRLKDASPEELAMIAKHDPDMIREVAAVALSWWRQQSKFFDPTVKD